VSLILDALRRADSERERERGAVPGLHAQQMEPAAVETTAAARALPWLAVAIVAAAVLLAAAAWLVAGRDAPRAAAAPAVAQSVAQAPALPPAPPGAAAASAPPLPAPTPAANPSEPRPVAEPAPWTSPDGGRKAGTEAVAAAAAPMPEVRILTAPSVAPAEARITSREQLPEDLRAQLPPLAVGGSIYSASAAERSLIIDGRIARENDRLTADLTLEQIRPKSAVLRFKGHRFEIVF
jgi:general secretion pathway protein B